MQASILRKSCVKKIKTVFFNTRLAISLFWSFTNYRIRILKTLIKKMWPWVLWKNEPLRINFMIKKLASSNFLEACRQKALLITLYFQEKKKFQSNLSILSSFNGNRVSQIAVVVFFPSQPKIRYKKMRKRKRETRARRKTKVYNVYVP